MTYDYECSACGAKSEREQSIKDPPLTLCEACGAVALKRLVSGGACFQLKGDGWGRDLYSKPAPSKDSSPK